MKPTDKPNTRFISPGGERQPMSGYFHYKQMNLRDLDGGFLFFNRFYGDRMSVGDFSDMGAICSKPYML